MSDTKLFSIAIIVKQIQFEPKVSIKGNITACVEFLRYREQMIFDPVKPTPLETLQLNSGKTFMFGLSYEGMLEMCKSFVINLGLQQVNPEKRLSDTKLDITKIYRELFDDPCENVLKSEMSKTIEFSDKNGKNIANMDIVVRLSPSGQTIINEFNLDGNVDNQYVSVPNDCYGCPVVPDLKIPNKQHDDDGEWDIVCAELNNGQKIAIKYKRNYYEFKTSGVDELCEPVNKVKTSRSEEKFNIHMLELMEKMHGLLTSNDVEACCD